MSQSRHLLRTSLQILLIAGFLLLLLTPHLVKATRLVPERQLVGIRIGEEKRPSLTFRDWFSTRYAGQMDRWLRSETGLHAHFIMLNRQIRFQLFGQVTPAPMEKTSVIAGTPPWLHENLYLLEALRRPVIAPDRLDAYVASLADIQARLRRHGKAFVVVLAPQKALLHNGHLPRWARPHVADEHADFPAYLRALRRHGVHHVDSMALFRAMKTNHPHLVPPHGAHWSYHGAWITWLNTLTNVNAQQVIAPVEIPRTDTLRLLPPAGMDDELRGQLNLYHSIYAAPVPARYPVPAALTNTPAPPLHAMVVGDSFGFGLVDAMARAPLCASIRYLYYMRNIYEATPPHFDPSQSPIYSRLRNLGFKKDYAVPDAELMRDVNLVVLVCTSFNIDKFGWGFDRMVKALPE